jgi:alpha-ribazole phosphatase
MSTHPTRWWWIRHAPVPDSGRIYGQRDLDCDCGDAAVFSRLAELLPRDAVWVTSHLGRARQTAAAVAAAMGTPKCAEGAIALPALAEQHLGDWQGLMREEFHASRGAARHPYWLCPAKERAPNGESFYDLMERVAPVIEDLTEEFRGRDIVAVTHGGTIKAALAIALRIDPEAALAFMVENCSLTRIDHMGHEPYGWRVAAVNYRPR